jgi:hypothetical protein
MASTTRKDDDFVEFVCDQLTGFDGIQYKPMFGGYAILQVTNFGIFLSLFFFSFLSFCLLFFLYGFCWFVLATFLLFLLLLMIFSPLNSGCLLHWDENCPFSRGNVVAPLSRTGRATLFNLRSLLIKEYQLPGAFCSYPIIRGRLTG